ncbi:hypothetical protein [Ruminococcus sp.]|uniref:hypothetical protein n=1 Tax=Ruminococcus sp. TaxID=41978 RepID=UPI0025F7FA3B|nr:hypothetical protein [Ruminococcus sp.]
MADSTWDFVFDCGCNIEFVTQKAEELDKLIDNKADEIAKKRKSNSFWLTRKNFSLKC